MCIKYLLKNNIHDVFSENEKARRWEEIKIRQYRLLKDTQETIQVQPSQAAHLDHMLKSGFTMNDIKGLNRNYDDGTEADENMINGPHRPPRKGSLTRNITFESDVMSDNMKRSTSALDMNGMEEIDEKKKRGRSPFKFFSKKSRDQSKEKVPSRTREISPMERRNTVGEI